MTVLRNVLFVQRLNLINIVIIAGRHYYYYNNISIDSTPSAALNFWEAAKHHSLVEPVGNIGVCVCVYLPANCSLSNHQILFWKILSYSCLVFFCLLFVCMFSFVFCWMVALISCSNYLRMWMLFFARRLVIGFIVCTVLNSEQGLIWKLIIATH